MSPGGARPRPSVGAIISAEDEHDEDDADIERMVANENAFHERMLYLPWRPVPLLPLASP